MGSINPGLVDYSVDVTIKTSGSAMFIPANFNLEGTYYYKKPDKHKLKLKKSLKVLEKYPNVFGYHLPSLKEYSASVKRVTSGGRTYYLVILTPYVKVSDVIRQEFWIDADTYTFFRHITDYENGGNITVNISCRKQDGYYLYDKLNAYFTFPKINTKVNAFATYGDYKINIGLTDDFFNQK